MGGLILGVILQYMVYSSFSCFVWWLSRQKTEMHNVSLQLN